MGLRTQKELGSGETMNAAAMLRYKGSQPSPVEHDSGKNVIINFSFTQNEQLRTNLHAVQSSDHDYGVDDIWLKFDQSQDCRALYF